MFRRVLSMLVLIFFIQTSTSQPLPCKEDTHCSEGYYCEIHSNICEECLKCQDLKREPPKFETSNCCIKSIEECGHCSEGFVNIYGNGAKGKCVVPEFFEFGSQSRYTYVWITAAAIGLIICVIFVYVIKHTRVFQVVVYYEPVSGSSPSEIFKTFSPRRLKQLLYFNTPPKPLDIIQYT